jgi:cysteine synthase A
MPETMSVERRNILKAYGAQIVLTEGAKGMNGAIAKAEEITAQTPGAFLTGQFVNPSNPAAHYDTTGPEIWEALDGKVDILVAAVGTSGTSLGTGRFLRKMNPDIRIYGVEPAGCPVLNGGQPGPHKIQGIGGGAVCPITDLTLYNEILLCSDENAYKYARLCPKTEGLLIGISAGAALWAATEIARRSENQGKNIAVIFPDGGNKYLSSDLFD